MGSINEKLDYLEETKGLIKQAIINKGQSITDDVPFREYVEKISAISTGDFADASATINLTGPSYNVGDTFTTTELGNYELNTICLVSYHPTEGTDADLSGIIIGEITVKNSTAQILKVIYKFVDKTIGQVKLFETEEEMQADDTAKLGDLAIVYKSEIQNMTATTQTQYITFPETVTLPKAFTNDVYCMLRAVDETAMFDGQVMLSQSMFDFNGFSESGMIRVHYTSSDGVTYTRDEFMGDRGDLTNPVDLGTSVKVYRSEEWNNNLGYFMQINEVNFGGLYKYGTYTDNYILNSPLVSNPDSYLIMNVNNTPITQFSGITIIKETKLSSDKLTHIPVTYDIYKCPNLEVRGIINNGGQYLLGFMVYQRTGSENSYTYQKYEYVNSELTQTSEVTSTNKLPYFDVSREDSPDSVTTYIELTGTEYVVCGFEGHIKSVKFYTSGIKKSLPTGTLINDDTDYSSKVIEISESEMAYYKLAENQYNLKSSNQLLENISAYGKDGNITGTMPNNGELNYTPSDEEQTIPAGYTSGGSVEPISSSAIPNLVPENVVYGKQILDVVGITPDGSDFELVTTNSLGAIQATTSPGKEYSNINYFTNAIIVDSNGEPLGGFMAKGRTVYTFGWNGTDIVNKKTYSTSSLRIGSINEDAVYASNPDKNMSGIVGFICGSSHYVHFLTYEVKYTIENGVMCPSLEISNKKGKWRIYDSSVITTQVNFLSFNPWDKTSCVCHGSSKRDIFIKLNEPTTFDSYTDCTTVQYTRSSGAMLNLSSKGHFAKNGKVFYVRESSQDPQADVYYLTNNGLPAKKNNLGLILISGDGNYGINYNGNKVTLSYSDDGTVTINTGERIEGFETDRLNRYGIGTITNKVFVTTLGEWSPVVFYNIDWDNNVATKFGSFTPVDGKDLGYLNQHSLEDCGQNALFGACTNPNNYDYTAYPRMIFISRNLDEITAIKYKGELYYPNTIDSIEYQQALDTAIEIKGGNK